ncbi:hypothetical protein RBSH_04207 [Rhodopirellula baltica SH28]|uniref:Uncharacterized protein n=1 Tax=Rhodopirellula baltica SH28 TaxID=993517 RepID=K5CAX5_RHOBT|nr:hypothetical protein RBSH_04207 [Rhodopirellula baltica SH28]
MNQVKTGAQVEMPLGQVAHWMRHISSCFQPQRTPRAQRIA